MAVNLSNLANLGVNLQTLVAEKLGCPVETVPADKAMSLAKTLGLAPTANLVEYTTQRTNKAGVYLVVDSVDGFGREAVKVFYRLGNPDDPASAETIDTIRKLATEMTKRADSLVKLADTCEESLSDK